MMQRLGLGARSSLGYDPDFERWMHEAGQRLIAELVARHRLPLQGTWERRGVKRAAFGFETGGTVIRGETYRAAVASALQVRDVADVQTFTEYGRLYFSVPYPPQFIDNIDPWKLPPADGLRVCLGIHEGDKPVWWDMAADPHLLIGGPTKTGKSVLMRLILKGLLQSALDFRFAVLGVQAGDWDAALCFRQSWGFHGVEDAPRAVAWLLDENERRKAARVKTPPLVVLVDDLLALLDRRTGHPDLLPALTTLFVQARHQGFHFVAGLQVVSAIDGLGTLIKQTPRRIVTGAGSPDEAFRLAGVAGTGAERLKRGEVISVEAGKPTLVYVPRFEDGDLAHMRGGIPDPAPWASVTSVTTRPTVVSPPVRPVSTAPGGDTGSVTTPVTAPAYSFPLPKRPPTAEDAAALRWLRERYSINQTLAIAYGGKNGRYLDWLKAALEDSA